MRVIKIGDGYTIKETESSKQYLKDVSKIPLFATPEAEFECALKAMNGDEKAIKELATRNLRFVVSVAKQYKTINILLDDLINEGNIGLIEAATKFDPTHGNKFISYAVWYIRKDIMKYIYTHERLVRVPFNKLNALNMVNGEISATEQAEGRDVNINEVSDRPKLEGFTTADLNNLLELNVGNTTSMDKPLGDKDTSTLSDVLESTYFGETDAKLLVDDQLHRLELLLDMIDFKSSYVLKMYYGVGCHYQMKLKEIGEVLGISRERVRQIKEKALKDLAKLGNALEFNEML